MWAIAKKDFFQYFTNLSGSFFIIGFLVLNGFILFVNASTNVFDFGYANLDAFFSLVPWFLIVLCALLTMNSFSEEFRSQTYQLLKVMPLNHTQIVFGKFIGNLGILLCAILPTFIYAIALNNLSAQGGIDWGATITNYIGLIGLGICFLSIGIFCSSLSSSNLIAFFISVFLSYFFYNGLEYSAQWILNNSNLYYSIQNFSLQYHYKNMQYGLFVFSDSIFFILTVLFFLKLATRNLSCYEP
ncbi:MAG: ABC transporter permease subunit [Alphaproteobacteria bacterium]|nr:ABC transporter permease subunit [Alphaproteobacteria bacterium]